ncbi:MAG: aminodeoxychorismate synthase component I [Bacteroidetes bacterium GWA2_40_15]|nr:MAG: aminodeoxychorismate synthase component I [Bacteroidetes bacterium GWA2_40_15]HBH84858.1 aminodeoxychorismate synthase component I [Bacteroidales bacterium]
MSIKEQMNSWGEAGIPFLFIIDFELNKPLIFKLDEIDKNKILYSINGFTNSGTKTKIHKQITLAKHPEKFEDYLVKLNRIQEEIAIGNSYLLNLTCSTPIELNLTLMEVFLMSNSRYRIWFDDEFVCFSPEIFVTIRDGIIRSYPMKGTIDATIKDAEKIILNDYKEKAEHNTIVDLIRNDLSLVSSGVRVERFRYPEIIETNEKRLLQVSSEICGDLDKNYLSHLGDIFYSLLPAGSVSGAPKRKTTEIIAATEGSDRGYYTGVAGIFDGQYLDSFVLIRFIEKSDAGLIYRSGGGITSLSDPLSEYKEMIDKIYVPIV